MKPSKEAAAALLTQWQAAMQRSDELMQPAIDALKLPPESPPWQAAQELQSLATTLVAALVDDTTNALEWYWLENDMGAKKHEARHEGGTRQIASVQDLLWMLGYTS